MTIWSIQLVIWLAIVTVVKIIFFFIQLLFSDILEAYGSFVMSPFKGHGDYELIFVMIVVPVSMNIAQYWV